MNLFCYFRQRRMAKYIALEQPLPDDLAQHTVRCPECRSFQSGLTRLTDSLTKNLSVTTLTQDADDALLSRLLLLPHAAPSRRRYSYVWAVAALSASTLLWFFHFSSIKPLKKSGIVESGMRNRDSEQTAVRPPFPESHRVSTIENQKSKFKNAGLQSKIQHSKRHLASIKNPRYKIQNLSAEEIAQTRSVLALHYALCGDLLEQRGSPEYAEIVYRDAYMYQPSTSLAFAAGRAAETNGNSAQAFAFYAAILDKNVEGENPSTPDKPGTKNDTKNDEE